MKTVANISPAELIRYFYKKLLMTALRHKPFLHSFVWTIFLTAAHENVMQNISHTEFESCEYLTVLPSAEGLLLHKEGD